MKRWASKRTELGEFGAAIQPVAFGVGRTWRRRSVATACASVRSASARWPPASAGGVTGRGRGRPRGRGAPAAHSASAERLASVAGGPRRQTCQRLASRAPPRRLARCRVARGVRATWFLALRPTRLETRTKELSTRASRWARRTPVAQLRQNGRDPALACRRNAGPQPTRREWLRRKSACAQTRKVVNYA